MEKVVNYKVIDLFEIYNFNINFIFIWLYLKSYEFYYDAYIFRDDSKSSRLY